MKTRDRLRIAVQKSGRLSEASQSLLQQCGLDFRQSRDKLFCFGETHPVDLLLVRDDDIPGLIADGVCDLGFVGLNVLEEQQLEQIAQAGSSRLHSLRRLGYGGCRLSIALPQEEVFAGPESLRGRRIATSYPRLLARYLSDQRVTAEIVVLSGSVEIAPRLGSADVICDLVSSGATLVANQLKEAVAILQSEAVLAAATTVFLDARQPMLELLLRRLDGVLAVRETRLLLLRSARSQLAQVQAALPTAALTTVLGIDDQADSVALQVLVSGGFGWADLEAIQHAGATQLVVLPVARMLA
ncbi:MAG: ATP phosphoribosyltransferase [Lysobacterales bacterium CG02_land_8_20_14_3_00_62_12]|nr:MAG: ATP phosphoribosyltransferase [Xanthomonadales bacterium CG02_land_8_20_14_3_00_62_12]